MSGVDQKISDFGFEKKTEDLVMNTIIYERCSDNVTVTIEWGESYHDYFYNVASYPTAITCEEASAFLAKIYEMKGEQK